MQGNLRLEPAADSSALTGHAPDYSALEYPMNLESRRMLHDRSLGISPQLKHIAISPALLNRSAHDHSPLFAHQRFGAQGRHNGRNVSCAAVAISNEIVLLISGETVYKRSWTRDSSRFKCQGIGFGPRSRAWCSICCVLFCVQTCCIFMLAFFLLLSAAQPPRPLWRGRVRSRRDVSTDRVLIQFRPVICSLAPAKVGRGRRPAIQSVRGTGVWGCDNSAPRPDASARLRV